MNVSDLKEFLALARQNSFIEAAEDCYISQSTLSKHIKRLEKEIGYPLFNRSSARISLSDYGKLLLPYAERIVAEDAALRKTLKDHERKMHESLSIGSTPLLVPYDITGAISGFRKKYPSTSVNIVEGETSDILAALGEKKIRLAFILVNRLEEESLAFGLPEGIVSGILYRSDMLSAVLPAGHPLADRKSIPFSALEGEAFIFWPANTPMYDRCYNICLAHQFAPDIMLTAPRGRSIVEMVSHNMGVSIMSRQQALGVRDADVAVVPLEPVEPLHVYLVTQKNVRLSDMEQRFAAYIKGISEESQ